MRESTRLSASRRSYLLVNVQEPRQRFEVQRRPAKSTGGEVDALANKDFRYPTKTYLPRKLKEEEWLD